VENTVKITASEVNRLRQQTGAGMMDCKKALTEANGDFEKAVEVLRKKGQKVAANRSDRSATEGYVLGLVTSDNSKGVLVALNCETDFVAKNQDFIDFATKITTMALENGCDSVDALGALSLDGRVISEHITDMVGKIGEKIEIGCCFHIDGSYVLNYNHPGNRVATLVALNKNDVTDIASIAKDVAMQAAAMAPIALNKDEVSSEVIEKEIEIAKEQLLNEGKPADKIEMIARGKLEKFFKENTLLNQDFIKDGKVSVQGYLQKADKELTVSGFRRYALGS
jgi:elongation factor Ts